MVKYDWVLVFKMHYVTRLTNFKSKSSHKVSLIYELHECDICIISQLQMQGSNDVAKKYVVIFKFEIIFLNDL